MSDKKVEKIKLSEIVELCEKYAAGETSQGEMVQYGNNMKIRGYLPILEKLAITTTIVLNHLYSDSESQEIKTAELYKYMFFYGLLGGYALIDCSERELVSFKNYDLIYPIFYPFLMDFCREDYQLFKEFVKDTINFYQAKELGGHLENINPDVLERATESNKELFNQLEKNTELFSYIKELKELDNPLAAELIKKIKEESIKIAKK